MEHTYTYRKISTGHWSVGHNDQGRWVSECDLPTRNAAASRVYALNLELYERQEAARHEVSPPPEIANVIQLLDEARSSLRDEWELAGDEEPRALPPLKVAHAIRKIGVAREHLQTLAEFIESICEALY